jgi:carboxyl-terminal processing protease
MKTIYRVFFLCVLLGATATVANAQFSEQSLKFGEVLDKITRYYVDTVNADKILDKVIVDMLHDLDPHSAYLSKEEVKASQEQLEGGFDGIGVSFNILSDTIFIINPIAGGPSEKVGIRPGDRIIYINGENVAGTGIKNTDVQKKLKGPKGTKVEVRIARRNVSNLLDFTITRDQIPLYSIDASYMVDERTGYIKLSRFSNTSIAEFKEAMKKLKALNMQNLILDLSGNGGGYLWVAVDLADEFLGGRRLIVYTEGEKNPKRDFFSTEAGSLQEGKLVVMLDETSASASEIVSGALQDWDRAVVVGRRSFGKGLVQGRFELQDGSELRLTVAKYYTPTGRLIQKPYDEGYDAYSKELAQRYTEGELSTTAGRTSPDSLKYTTLVNKRTVYGGGGITPDVIVPIDTAYYSDYYRELISKGIFNQFILTWVDKNRRELGSRYPDFNVFNEYFVSTPAMMEELIGYATREGVDYNEEDFKKSETILSLLFKAYVARDLWETSEFYQVYNAMDPIFLKAVEIINDDKEFRASLMSANSKQ